VRAYGLFTHWAKRVGYGSALTVQLPEPTAGSELLVLRRILTLQPALGARQRRKSFDLLGTE
jgi:hypothetical protein